MAERTNAGSTTDPPEEPAFLRRPGDMKQLPLTRTRAFLGLVSAGTKLEAELDARLRRQHDLGIHAFEVLLFLALFCTDGTARVNALVKQAPLSQSRVSRLARDLEARGLVRRSHAPDDGRGVIVAITDTGLELFRHAQETHLADLDELLFSHLTWHEVTQLAAITSKVVQVCDPDAGPDWLDHDPDTESPAPSR